MNQQYQGIFEEEIREIVRRLNVYLIDNQSLYRMAVRQVLANEWEVVGESSLNDVNITEIEDIAPDIVLLDVGMPLQNGFGVARQISNRCPKVAVVIISPNPDDEQLFQAIKSGAVAFLNKDASPQKLLGTLKKVGQGEYPINYTLLKRPDTARKVMRLFHKLNSAENCYTPLSSREKEILKYIAEGNPNKTIAEALHISEQTIKNHVTSIMRKLNANDRTHAVVLAMHQGLLNIGEIAVMPEEKSPQVPLQFREN